jgi:CheY-like chemotaxis protein/nitrogen-specific signal transduction histidine kinase
MQSSKIDFISKYNNLINVALSSTLEFPDNVCEFLVNEYEFDSVVLVKVKEKGFEFLGKSSEAKKTYKHNSQIGCNHCAANDFKSTETKFEQNSQCEFKASDLVQHEGCLHLSVADNEKVLLKIAKKSEFTQSDKDNLIIVGESIRNLLRLWMGKKGGLSSSVSEIVSSIGHELRTPTNSIIGFAALLSEDNLSTSQNEYVSTLRNNAYELLSLINDLVDIAKLDGDKGAIVKDTVVIKEMINEVVKQFDEKIDKNRIELLYQIDDNVPEKSMLDLKKLRFILVSLITVSLRLTEHGKMSLSVFASEKNTLRFRITDTGAGIPANKVEHIFDPFVINELYNSTSGSLTGLGLTLTKRYIDFLNADFEIQSTVNKGTTFTLTIPVEEISEIESQISSLPKPGKLNKVLVVEDDYATSKLLGNYLHKWGYEPTIVNSAEQTLKIVEQETFLAILMDIILPDANGLELLQQIRENKNTKRTPVIICSVESEQQKAFLMGAVEYFVKPINYKYLVEVLTSYKLRKDSNILMVDDDIPTVNLLKEAVAQAGFNPIAESDSTKVLDRVENLRLDLAIVDLDMPEIDGVQLIEMLKSKEQFKNLPIIIYTGKERYEEDTQRIDGLFSTLLHKSSTNIEELQDTITSMINKYDEPSTPEEVKQQKDTVKILLVEDYKHSQIIVTRLLKKNNFESIVVVENGQEALEAVKQQRYDLILMDMQMPVMNGFEASRRIRELVEYKDTPIIALTAFAMKGDREKCLDAGATDYIPKPIDSQEFIQKVKYYTEQKESVKN